MPNVNVLQIGNPPHIFSFSHCLSSVQFSHDVLDGWQRYLRDGVKQLNQIDYMISSIHPEKLYTHILVNLTRASSQKLEYLLQ